MGVMQVGGNPPQSHVAENAAKVRIFSDATKQIATKIQRK